jgi:tetratricopeptide (TPR) repeat protein
MSSLTSIKPEHGSLVMEPAHLKEAASKAVKLKHFPRATHIYTLAIDMLVKGSKETKSTEEVNWLSLQQKSNGLLHILLSNRSFTHFKCKDFLAAAQDAEHCIQSLPTFVKGYLRLLTALKALHTEEKSTLEERVKVVSRGFRACGSSSKPLILAREALVKESSVQEVMTIEGKELETLRSQMKMTKDIADDKSDPRHTIAAGDYGSALALGVHGLDKDVIMAEKYLKIASVGGDAVSARNYGHLLLKLNRAGEASQQFAHAANLGDAEAGEILRSLNREAEEKREEAMNQLRKMADAGNERAREMLQEFQRRANRGSNTPP